MFLLAAMLLAACADMNYDTTDGRLDKEITLFNDQVSLPVGDFGPVSMGLLIDKAGVRESIGGFVAEDEDGYLVVEQDGDIYSNAVILLSMMIMDPTQPAEVRIADCTGSVGTMASALSVLKIIQPLQVFSLYATNPLTEGISVSGSLKLLSEAEGVISQDFSKQVATSAEREMVLEVESKQGASIDGFELTGLKLNLPASLSEKDPLGGLGFVGLKYHYKSYLSLGEDFSFPLEYDLTKLNIPIGQYKVREAKICLEVSNELPVTLVLDNVGLLVDKTTEDGHVKYEPLENVTVSAPLSIASGTSGNPVVSPLEIVIKADEGTIPDIEGIRLNASIQAPTGTGDQRLGMNQNIYFNNIRATVSGGITIQNL